MANVSNRNNQYTITDQAHIALTQYVKEREIYLAWGKLPVGLIAPTIGTKVATLGGDLAVGNHRYRVTAYTDFGETTGSVAASVDLSAGQGSVNLGWSAVVGAVGYKIYKLDTTSGNYYLLATVQGLGHLDTTGSVTTDLLPLANTTVVDPWTTDPIAPAETIIGLYNEVGRRRANIKKYVKRDPDGEIETAIVNSNNELEIVTWSESTIPTNNLYLQVGYALTDAHDQTIYQFGVFTDTIPTSGNENKNYLLPDQIQDKGQLMAVANVAPVYRDATSREIREVIITF